MIYSMADIQEIASEYYLALIEVVDHCLGDQYWAQNVASDLRSAAERADRRRNLLYEAKRFDQELLDVFESDFRKTMRIARKLSKPEAVPDQERGALLNEALSHRTYLEGQATGYLGRLAKLTAAG